MKRYEVERNETKLRSLQWLRSLHICFADTMKRHEVERNETKLSSLQWLRSLHICFADTMKRHEVERNETKLSSLQWLRSLHICFVVLFCSISLSAQTGKDSLSLSGDSIRPVAPGPPVSADTHNFKPQYRRDVMYIIKTNLNIKYTGYIVRETEYEITIEEKYTGQRYDLRKGEVAKASVFSTKQTYAKIMGENYHADNYMLSTSAFLFKKETINSKYHWFILDNLDYTFNENWAVNVTTIFIYPVALGMKCAFKIDDHNYIGGNVFGMVNIAAGGGTSPNEPPPSLFLGYGALGKYTRGTSNENITVGGGLVAFNNDALFPGSSFNSKFLNLFFANAAYCNRLSEYVAVNLEGWYLPAAQIGFAGVGFKLVSDESSCWTFGCYGVVNFQNNNVTYNFKAIPIPYFGLTQKL